MGAELHFDPSQKQNSSLVLVTTVGSTSVERRVSLLLLTLLLLKKLLITWLLVFTSEISTNQNTMVRINQDLTCDPAVPVLCSGVCGFLCRRILSSQLTAHSTTLLNLSTTESHRIMNKKLLHLNISYRVLSIIRHSQHNSSSANILKIFMLIMILRSKVTSSRAQVTRFSSRATSPLISAVTRPE